MQAKAETHPDDGWPVIPFVSAAELESWLEDHCEDETGFWVKIAKKTSGIESITSNEVIELGLCFGWVDNKTKGIDDDYYGMRTQPRKPRSNWSERNKGIVERLTAEGRMRPTGVAEVEAAKADGRWDAS